MNRNITISIISHHQNQLINSLLQDLEKYCAENVEVIVTLNLPEDIPSHWQEFKFPINYISNDRPKGFGANHNAAYKASHLPYFCILNPDIRLSDNSLVNLITDFENHSIGVVAPKVVDDNGTTQDNARKFITLSRLLRRVILNQRNLDYDLNATKIYPDWIAGMCMMFSRESFEAVNGFDEKYYLYCEDLDICARLKKHDYRALLDTRAKVIHSARRDSHRKLKYLWWHMSSMCRYFYRYYFAGY